MPQADLNVANQSGLAFRQDLNNQLLALGTLQSGSSAPSTTYAYMLWADTSTSPATVRMRNGANNAWIVVGTSDTANLGLLPSATAASTYAPLTGTGASGTWPISISGNAATATTATTATTLSGTGSLSALDYSYTADFPSVRPSLLLDFANSKALDPRVSFSRASTGTYVGADGLIKTAAINEPRFDHNPSTGESLGLLIEESRTNLLTYSEQFNNAAWTKSNTTVSANAAIAPDGTTTADLVYPNSTGSGRSLYQSAAGTIGVSYTRSIFLKTNGIRYACLGCGGPSLAAWFDLQNGTVGTIAGGVTATIQSYGSGWYRCSVTNTASGTTIFFGDLILASADNSTSVTANGTDGIYYWGAQLEAGAFPTSYIPTTAATVTRSADVAQMTGTNFTSWYRQDEGTVYCQATSNSTANSAYWSLQGSSSNGITVLVYPSNRISYQVIDTSAQADLNFAAYSSVGVARTAAAYKANDFAVAGNGGTVSTDTSGTVPTLTSFVIGNYPGGGTSYDYSGTISRLAFYPLRLSNAQLQNLTAV